MVRGICHSAEFIGSTGFMDGFAMHTPPIVYVQVESVVTNQSPHRTGREGFPHPVPRCRTFPYGKDATCGSTPHHPSPSADQGTYDNLRSSRLVSHFVPTMHDPRCRKLELRHQTLKGRPVQLLPTTTAVQPVTPGTRHLEVHLA